MTDIVWSNVTVTLGQLQPWERNPKSISKAHAKRLLASWDKFGQFQTVAIGPGCEVYDGHQRLSVLRAAYGDGYSVAARQSSRELSDAERRELVIAAHVGTTGQFNWDELANWDADQLQDWGMDAETLASWRADATALTEMLAADAEITDSAIADEKRATLSDRFIVPPFSVLDARQGYWQARKKSWIDLGIRSEIGRGGGGATPPHPPSVTQNKDGTLNYGGSKGQSERFYRQIASRVAPGGSPRDAASLGANGRTQRGDGRGKPFDLCYTGQSSLNAITAQGKNKNYAVIGGAPLPLDRVKRQRLTWVSGDRLDDELDETSRKNLAAGEPTGTSIFDPVLCELAYRWFMPRGGRVLDPFAGGSVRGIVASILGYDYTGIDLSDCQIEANEQQAADITPNKLPRWIVGDSRNVGALAAGEYDMIFSCPPYADLEVYSDNPQDLSTLEYNDFIEAYRQIIAACVAMLKNNRFACFVVGDVRDKKGFYRNFPAHTIDAFQDAGMTLYNEAILVTAVGSLPIRVGRQFGGYRKLGKTHQNVLVFYKGDPKAIKDFGDVECGDIGEGDAPQ